MQDVPLNKNTTLCHLVYKQSLKLKIMFKFVLSVPIITQIVYHVPRTVKCNLQAFECGRGSTVQCKSIGLCNTWYFQYIQK